VVERSAETPFQRMGSLSELEARITQAGKPVMLDFQPAEKFVAVLDEVLRFP